MVSSREPAKLVIFKPVSQITNWSLKSGFELQENNSVFLSPVIETELLTLTYPIFEAVVPTSTSIFSSSNFVICELDFKLNKKKKARISGKSFVFINKQFKQMYHLFCGAMIKLL